ncbi:ataxin-2 homolog [Mytilus edulis]|uniref:ataxin-2 homolog n=1 Tax=Mytilus edulis TaxID=6550 RepID=UPI0039EDE8AA
MDTQQEPPVANLQKIDQQVINRPQPVNNSHRQDITSVSSDDTPNDHVLHFSPRVQHGMPYRQQDQQEAGRLQQASPAHYRLVNSNSPVIQQRGIYPPETPSVECVKQFQPPIQQDNYHRQLQFKEYDTVIPSTNKYQVGTNNIQSGVNRVQPPTLQSQSYEPSPQQVLKPQIGSINQPQGVNRVQQPMLPVKKGVQMQQQVQSLHQRLAQLQLGVNSYAQPTQQQNPTTAPVSLPQQQLHQQQPAYQQPRYQPPNFVPGTQPPTTIGHPTSMFQPPRIGPPPQEPSQYLNHQNMSSISYPVMGQPTFSGPPDISNYQPQSHTLPVQQQQPPSSGAPPLHSNQPSARRKEYDSDYHERQRRRDPGRYYTADSDTSDASPYRQTRNKRRSAPAYMSDHSHRAFSPMRSARTSPAYSRHSSRRGLTARESQSESETDSGHSRSQSKKNKKIEKRQFLSSIPKTLRYNGKGNWKAFYTKFSGYAKIAEWTDEQKREQLCWCLDDAASEYYTLMLDNNKSATFTKIISNMNKRFGHQELPETSQVQFQTSAQG